MACKFHEMTDSELDKQLELARSEIRELRFNYAVARSLQDPSRIRKLKRNNAKMLTIIKERQLGITTQKDKTKKGKKAETGKKKETVKKGAAKKSSTKKTTTKKEDKKNINKEKVKPGTKKEKKSSTKEKKINK